MARAWRRLTLEGSMQSEQDTALGLATLPLTFGFRIKGRALLPRTGDTWSLLQMGALSGFTDPKFGVSIVAATSGNNSISGGWANDPFGASGFSFDYDPTEIEPNDWYILHFSAGGDSNAQNQGIYEADGTPVATNSFSEGFTSPSDADQSYQRLGVPTGAGAVFVGDFALEVDAWWLINRYMTAPPTEDPFDDEDLVSYYGLPDSDILASAVDGPDLILVGVEDTDYEIVEGEWGEAEPPAEENYNSILFSGLT